MRDRGTSTLRLSLLAGAAAAILTGGLLLALSIRSASAMPEFARRYNLSCAACHAAVPRLNKFGEQFDKNNMRLPNWKETADQLGDSRLALPDHVPIAIRAQAYVQARQGKSIDPVTGTSRYAATDIQAPYLVKLISGAPLSDNLTYYFYTIFGEKGGNGEAVLEDAWFRYANLFGSGMDMQLGQFSLSDLMFNRETRMTFQDYMTYRLAGLTYDRALQFNRDVGPVSLALGVSNGNGIHENFAINSPGFNRPDKMFDNDSSKTVFGRIGAEIGPINAGLFGASGKQRSVTGPAGTVAGARSTDKRVVGVDASGQFGPDIYWFGQYLWSAWDGFLDANPSRNYRWNGGFAGLDWIPNERWAFSALYNYDNAGGLARSDTIYEGLAMNSLTFTASYYFMRNVKGVVEFNYDFLHKTTPTGIYYVGHLTRENYVLFGFDTAF